MGAVAQAQRAKTSYHQMSVPICRTKVNDGPKMQRMYMPIMNQPRIGQSTRVFKPAVQMSMT